MKALWGGCLLLLVLPVGLAAQHVAIGPQVAFGDYREVSSDLHYRGAGGGAKATLMWKKFSADVVLRSEEHTSELQSLAYLVCRLLLEKKKKIKKRES